MGSDLFFIALLSILWIFGGFVLVLMLVEGWHQRKERRSGARGVGSGDANQYGSYGGDAFSGGGDGGGDGGGGGD